MPAPNPSLPTVLILGAGGSGARTALSLSKSLPPSSYNLILLDQRPYYVHWPAMIRMVVTSSGNLEDTALIPLDKTVAGPNGVLKMGVATQIVPAKDGSSGGSVLLESGESIPYAILVLALGSIWEGPLALPNTKSETVAWAGEWRKRFEQSSSVVLAGGGAVGLEMAGEIRDCWPDKKITLVHGDRALLSSAYPDKYRRTVLQGLQKRNIQVILDDYIDLFPAPGSASSITTRKGQTLTADLVVPTRGGKPNTSLVQAAFPDVVDSAGRIKVLPTLQLPGHPTVFAAGDITNLPEMKQVAKYPSHASLISANILSLTSGQSPTKEYKKQPELILVTNGKEGGSAYLGFLWGIVLGDWFARMMKSRELMVGMTRKGLGYA